MQSEIKVDGACILPPAPQFFMTSYQCVPIPVWYHWFVYSLISSRYNHHVPPCSLLRQSVRTPPHYYWPLVLLLQLAVGNTCCTCCICHLSYQFLFFIEFQLPQDLLHQFIRSLVGVGKAPTASFSPNYKVHNQYSKLSHNF